MKRYRLHQGKLREHPEGEWIKYDEAGSLHWYGMVREIADLLGVASLSLVPAAVQTLLAGKTPDGGR
jgi:hypothetical protein